MMILWSGESLYSNLIVYNYIDLGLTPAEKVSMPAYQ